MAVNTVSAVLSFLFLCESVPGIVINVVVILSSLDYILKGKSMNTIDKIMFSLSFSNMCHGFFLTLTMLNSFLNFSREMLARLIVREMVRFAMNSSAWLTSCLCFFYFIKIVHFRWRFLSVLKMKIDVLVPWMILLVELVSIGNGFINIVVEVSTQNPSSCFYFSSCNNTDTYVQKEDFMYQSTFVSLAMVILVTAGTLVSLQLHVHKTSRTLSSSSNLLSGPHSAIRTMAYPLIYYLLFFVTLVLVEVAHVQLDFLQLIYTVLKLSFCPVQSLLLIFGNPRHKKMFCNAMHGCYKMCT